MADFDLRRIVGEIAARHGIRLSADDPALAIATLNRLILEETIESLENRVHKMEESIDQAGQKVERRGGMVLAQEAHQLVGSLRAGFDSKASLYCSLPVGLFCVVIVFSLGILVGWNLYGMIR
jgi:hypothetical protein